MAENGGSSNSEGSQKERKRVGLVYDERMCDHHTPDGSDHPECPDRIRVIWDKLNVSGLTNRCEILNAKEAEDKHIQLVHSKYHVDMIKTISSKQFDSKRKRIASQFNSIYLNKGSSKAAYLAAGSVLEDKPCEICGATGYEGCIVVCHRCKITREHMYCMRIVHQGDPEHWVCEECKPGDQSPTSKLVSNQQPSDVTTRFNIRKPPRNTKVQYISPEEAMVLESGAQKTNLTFPSKSNSSCRPTVNRIFASKTEASRCTTIPPKLSAKHNTPERPPGFTNLQSTRSLHTLWDKKLPASKDTEKSMVQKQRDRQESPSVIGLSAKKALTTNANTEEKSKGPPRLLYANKDTSLHLEESPKSNMELGSPANVRCKAQAVENLEQASVQSVEHLPTVSSGVGVCVDAQSESLGSDGKKPLRLALDLDKYLLNHPAEIPTWKGRINIPHTDDILHCRSFDGIQAHPPCKVHRKVYDLSKELPKTLQVELLPRLNFWASLFEDDAPGALDIGLYFLSPKGAEQNLTSLLEFLDEHDMLLRSEIDGVELLFISSRHLPKDSQRINQTFFLWGLFRSAEKAVIAETREESGEDMDIDMSGGHEVGIVDMVISKPAENPKQEHTVLDVIPLKKDCRDVASPILRDCRDGASPIHKDCRDGASPIITSVTSFLEKQLDFEGDLQRSLDRFLMLNQPEEV